MNLRNQKGFALALVLCVTSGILLAMTAGFLGMTRLQMQMARSSEKIKTHWIAAAMLEAAIYEFEVQRKLSGTQVVDFSQTILDDIETGVLGEMRLSWADPGESDPDLPSGHGRYEKSLQITKEFVDGGYNYWVEAYAKDITTKADTVIRQKIRLYKGSIFDFGVFYENDLEITPGADMQIQGPIFSNGNIYLMSPVALDPDNPIKLRIETPGSGLMDYAIKAAGNIYFYNKPFVGRNYLLDSPIYANAVPSLYKQAYYKSVEVMRNGSPLIYFARNAVLNIWNQKSGNYYPSGNWWVEESCFKNIDDVPKDCGHHIELKSGVTIKRLQFPSINYDLSVYWSAHDTWQFPTHTIYPGVYGQSYLPYENTASQKYMSFSATTDGLSNKLNAFSYDELFPPGVNDFSFYGAVNPGWRAAKNDLASPANFGKRIIDDRLDRIEINLGKFESNTADNHLIIEPITNLASVSSVDTDTTFSNDPRLAVKADVIFFCADATCSTIRARLTAPDNAQANPDDDVIITSIGDLGGSTGRCFDDKRLGARVHVLRVNLNTLTSYLLSSSPQRVLRPDAVVAYFETKPMRDMPLTSTEISSFDNGSNVNQAASSCGGPVRAVEFYNGAQAPIRGMTLVTNGHAWIQLDGNGVDIHFNNRIRDSLRSDCATSNWPNCDLPPVGIFSDSFGIDTHEVNVSRDHVVNAAIISGYVPSQLEKVYPGCDGTLANMSKCDVGRDDMLGSGGEWLQSEQTIDTVTGNPRFGQGDWIPNKFPSGAWYAVVDCPLGLDGDGQPIDPQGCFSYWDKATGIFYLRRAWIYQWFYKRMVTEYNDYETKKTAWEAKPSGAGNVYKELSAFMSLPAFTPTMKTNAEAVISGLLSGSEDFSAQAALNDLKTALPGLLDAQGVFKPQSPLFRYYDATVGTILLAYEVRPPSDPYAGNVLRDATNLSGENNPWLWVPVGADEKLKIPGSSSDLAVNSYDPAEKYNFVYQGKYYKFYWREPWFDFGLVPEWKIPMNITSTSNGSELNYEYKNSVLDANWFFSGRHNVTSRNVYLKDNLTDPDPGVWYMRSHELAHPMAQAAVPPLPGMLQFVIDPIRMTGVKYVGDTHKCTGATSSVPPDETGGLIWGGQTGCSGINGLDIFDSWREYEVAGNYPQRIRLQTTNAVYGGYLGYNWSGYYLPLYRAKFSGGYENLINLQNKWQYSNERKTTYFSGTMTAPWYSKELMRAPDSPAFYGTSYYTAPIRKFDYDESLSSEPPPAAPSTFTISRTDYEEGYRK